MEALIGIAWCAMVVASFAGWGDAVLRGVRQQRAWRLCFVAGLAFVVMLGGLLNWVHLITSGICIALVVVGVALALWKALREGVSFSTAWVDPRVRRWLWVFGCVCVVLLVVRLLGSVHRLGYQYLDDLSEYLTFPKKMLEMHFFAADPFSERRIINSVGPAYFLQALVLSALPLVHLQMADTAVGLLLLTVFLVVLLQRWQVSVPVAGVVLALALGTLESTFNLSFTTLPSALFVAMVMVACEELPAWVLGGLEGALIAVVVGLKGVYLTHAAVFGGVLLVMLLWRRGLSFSVRAACGAVGAMVLVLGPWMVAMRETSGTLLYPVLGKGFHYDAFRAMEATRGNAWPDGTVLLQFAMPLVLTLAVVAMRQAGDVRSDALLALAVGASMGSLLLVWATGGDSPIRYNAASLVPVMLLVLALSTVEARGIGRWALCSLCLVGSITTIERVDHSLTFGQTHAMSEVGAFAHNFAAAFRPVALPHARDRAEYVALEGALPQGSTTLTTLTTPYFFDFSQRKILLAGFPGAASLPPGWPVDGDGDALAGYLLAHGVGYLAYSYGDEANYPDAALKATIALPHGTAVIRNEARLILAAHRQYDELAMSRKHVFDDGRVYLLDLSQRR